MDEELQRTDITSAGLRAFLGLEHSEALPLDAQESRQPSIERQTTESQNDREELDETFELLKHPATSRNQPCTPEGSEELHRPPSRDFKERQKRQKNPKLSGWRAGVLSCSVTAFGVLIVNFILMVWSIAKHRLVDGYAILYNGDCDQARTMSTTLHLLINILSTVLLSASNYTMQCLHSPTRKQIDKAHALQKWLDIGIPSWRNRSHVRKRNKVLWWLLGLSSIPLHFIYNSVVFLDIAAQEYNASFANETLSQLLLDGSLPGPETTYVSLDWQDCVNTYNRPFVFDHGDLVFITHDTKLNGKNSTTHLYESTYFRLQSSPTWGFNKSLSNMQVSLVGNISIYHNVTSCYSETAVGHCTIKFDIPIIVIVIICNSSKAVCMLITAWMSKDFPLVTLGDAIASFLEDPDLTTKDMCLLSKEEIEKAWSKPRTPRKWKPIAEKGYYSVPPRRWLNVNLLFYGTFIALVIGLSCGIQPNKAVFSTGIGFGPSLHKIPTILSSAIAVSGWWGNFRTTLLVNTPQVLVSLMNVLYNGLLSAMMLVTEWNSFSQQRQSLRVTVPSGDQRSKYYLSVPYHYGVPLLVLTGIFHWLISESFFLVSITAYHGTEIQASDSVFGIGYSALAMALASLTCFLLILLLTYKSLQRYKLGMPMAGSCSAAISAACHKVDKDESLHLKKLMWGVVEGQGETIGTWKSGKGFGHCSFSSALVAPPIPGRLYAGE